MILPSHSCLIWSCTLRLTVTSARTRAGQLSPILGLATSTMEKAVIIWAILAQPPNTAPPYSDCLCKGTDNKKLDRRCGLSSRLKSVGFRTAHGTTAYLFTFAGNDKQVATTLDIMGALIMLSNGFPNMVYQMSQSFNKILSLFHATKREVDRG